ncbi:mannose-6-phosphate isomerase [Aplysia californica]|uniref:mannose-6-phosphate isomerase n=1 Tax=Aplysia californica TaxID=6500 RepID=A0ABM1VSP5_APLCA|nr:mannose-6-phosphate isomerase [Aplysia californica]
MPIKYLLELRCSMLDNVWGKTGRDSLVARLKESTDEHFVAHPSSHYAQLWMGPEPEHLVSVKLEEGEMTLQDWVKEYPEQLGSTVNKTFGGKLPFLLKVLSIQTVLPLQAHPNKELAEKLHLANSKEYKDDHHKPEMMVALTPFAGLFGFRKVQELCSFVARIPELRKVLETIPDELFDEVVTENGQQFKQDGQEDTMKECFKALMRADKDTVSTELVNLAERITRMKKNGEDISHLEGEVFLKVYEDYPGDRGCFSIYFLNVLHLTPGEAVFVNTSVPHAYISGEKNGEDISHLEGEVFLKVYEDYPGDRGCFSIYFLNVLHLTPGEAVFVNTSVPHAYISGDCVECMASSDNLIRGAFTQKHMDIDTLIEMLDYSDAYAICPKLQGEDISKNDVRVTRFSTPFPDFGITKYEVPNHNESFEMDAICSPSICIVIKGHGTATCQRGAPATLSLKEGSTFFLAADTVMAVSCAGSGMLLYRGHVRVP